MPETVYLKGHASLFGVADLSGDIVQRGAFAETLRAGRRIPMLFQHDPSEPVGLWTRIEEDRKGLYVEGEIVCAGPRARTAARLVASGAVDGLSIGFQTRRSSPRDGSGRSLDQIDLWEVSIVTFPLLPGARLVPVPAPSFSSLSEQEVA